MKLRLFGLDFEVKNNNVIDLAPNPPLLFINENESRLVNGNLARMRIWLTVGNFSSSTSVGHSIYIKLDIKVRRSGDTYFPELGEHRQSETNKLIIEARNEQPLEESNSNASMLLKSGAFRIRESGDFPDRGVIGGLINGENQLTFHLQNTIITQSDRVPLSINIVSTDNAQKGFYLDFGMSNFSVPAIIFQKETFQANVKTSLTIPSSNNATDFSLNTLFSEEVGFSLNNRINSPLITFAPSVNSSEPLFLHTDLLNPQNPYSANQNPLVSPIEIENYKLAVQLFKFRSSITKITGVTVKPTTMNGEERFLLRNYAFANTQNIPLELKIKDELNLHIRVGTINRPTTFLISPEYQSNAKQIKTESISANKIHGLVKNSNYNLGKTGYLYCDRRRRISGNPNPNAPSNTPWIDERIISEITAPWLMFESLPAQANSFFHEKPGETYSLGEFSPGNLKVVDTFEFQGRDFALPTIPSALFNRDRDYKSLEIEQLDYINQRYVAGLKDSVKKIQHETLLKEKPTNNPDIYITRVFKPKSPQEIDDVDESLKVQEVKLAPYQVIRDYGPISIKFTVDPNINRDYFIIKELNNGSTNYEIQSYDLFLDKREDFNVIGHPTGTPNLPHGILKLSDRFTIEEILTKEGFDSTSLSNILDDDVSKSGWLGLILFKVPIIPSETGSQSQIIRAVVPNEGLNLEYVAITPEKSSSDADRLKYSVNARVKWTPPRDAPEDNPTTEQESETIFALEKLDILWRDSELNSFDAEASVKFNSFLSITKSSNLKILGSYDKSKDTIRFLGQLNNPIDLLPENIVGPIKQISIKSAEILYSQGSVAIDIDGQIQFQEFSIFKIAEGALADFESLQIRLPRIAGDGSPVWLGIEYPNLRLKFNIPPLRFGFLALKFKGFGINWNSVNFNPPGMTSILGFDTSALSNISFFLDLRLELMKMPELSTGVIEKLTFDFLIGIGRAADRLNFDLSKLRIWLQALSFENLNIDLMRFLRISVEEVSIEQRTITNNGQSENVTWLKFTGVKVIILDKVIVNNLTIFIFSSSNNRKGFVAYYASEDNPETPSKIIQIHWILIGNNIFLEPDLAKQIIAVDYENSRESLQTRIKSSVDNGEISKLPEDSGKGSWIFAASFTLLGDLLDGKFLFQDKAYYGICIGGGIFKEWFGYDFSISVLYIKANDPNQDSFVVSVAVPMVVLPAFTFMGGVITIEIVMNGGFTLDVGFPHLMPSGGRQWNRTFGAIIFPFQGSGGFYIQKKAFSKVTSDNNVKALVLTGGYALQGGLGASFGGPTFRVWVTAGFYYILEGQVLLCNGKLRGLKLVGACGILVRGAGELNWWIISIRVEVTLSAEARITFTWGNAIPEGEIEARHCLVPTSESFLDLNFTVYARVRAEACIGKGWFKICKGISVSLPLRFGYRIKLN